MGRGLVALLVLSAAPVVRADPDGFDVGDIVSDVGEIVSKVTGDLSSATSEVSDLLHLQDKLKVRAPGPPVAAVAAGIGERYLALVGSDRAVRVWDFETGAQLAVEGMEATQGGRILPNERDANLIVVRVDGRVDSTVGLSLATKSTILPARAAADAVAVSSHAPVLAAAGGGQLHVYNLATRKTVGVDVQHPVSGMEVSDDGRFVAYRTGSILRMLDVDARTPTSFEATDVERFRFFHDADGALGIAVQTAPRRLTVYRHDGRGFPRTGEHTFCSKPDDFWIGADRRVYSARDATLEESSLGDDGCRTIIEGTEPIVYVRELASGGNLVVVQRSGTLGVLNADTRKTVAAAVSTKNGWAVVDSQKRYDASASGGTEVAWVVGEAGLAMDLDLEKFARRFYEPGLLLHYVGQQLAFASTGHPGRFPVPPTVIDLKLLENLGDSGRTAVIATARSVSGDVASVEVYHNGKRLGDASQLESDVARRDDVEFRSSGFEVHPVSGPNTVAAVGVGSLGIEGPTRELSFQRPGVPRRVLHVVAVGIDRYAAPSLALGYAKGDAEAIAELMRASKGFERVTVSEFYDSDAAPATVLAALREIATTAAPDDTILLFLAGHAVAMDEGWFFLSPATTRFAKSEVRRLSMTAEQVSAVLRDAKASHVVLMIDACNSGAVVRDVKGLAQNRLYTKLGRSMGFAVLAASRQTQAALERATLGHGVFTAATMSALSGRADRNGDGLVTVRELTAYLSRQIPMLAAEHLNEVQIPVAYAPSQDFVVRALR